MAKVLEVKMKQNPNSSENIFNRETKQIQNTPFHLVSRCAGRWFGFNCDSGGIMGGIRRNEMEFPNVAVQNSNRNNSFLQWTRWNGSSRYIYDSRFWLFATLFFRNKWALHAKSTNTIAFERRSNCKQDSHKKYSNERENNNNFSLI